MATPETALETARLLAGVWKFEVFSSAYVLSAKAPCMSECAVVPAQGTVQGHDWSENEVMELLFDEHGNLQGSDPTASDGGGFSVGMCSISGSSVSFVQDYVGEKFRTVWSASLRVQPGGVYELVGGTWTGSVVGAFEGVRISESPDPDSQHMHSLYFTANLLEQQAVVRRAGDMALKEQERLRSKLAQAEADRAEVLQYYSKSADDRCGKPTLPEALGF